MGRIPGHSQRKLPLQKGSAANVNSNSAYRVTRIHNEKVTVYSPSIFHTEDIPQEVSIGELQKLDGKCYSVSIADFLHSKDALQDTCNCEICLGQRFTKYTGDGIPQLFMLIGAVKFAKWYTNHYMDEKLLKDPEIRHQMLQDFNEAALLNESGLEGLLEKIKIPEKYKDLVELLTHA